FGVVLGVLLIGKLPSDEFFQHTREMSLVKWLKNVMTSEDPTQVIDPQLLEKGYEEQMLLVLPRFKNISYLEQSRKMVNQEKFLKERIEKAEEQFRKQKSNNKEKMVNNIVFNCLTGRISVTSLAPCDLDDIARVVDQQINDVDERLVEISRRASVGAGDGGSSAAAPGKLPSDKFFQHTREMSLVKWLKNVMISEDQTQVIDPQLLGKGYEEQMLLVLKIACFCTMDDPKTKA
ncbi:Leucine-rich repeat receptor-like serine/threonine/tyrosine-protein kinase SOBIR1, partial [Linum grandiflorum]